METTRKACKVKKKKDQNISYLKRFFLIISFILDLMQKNVHLFLWPYSKTIIAITNLFCTFSSLLILFGLLVFLLLFLHHHHHLEDKTLIIIISLYYYIA